MRATGKEEKRTWRYFQLDCVGRCTVCLLVMTDDAKGAVTRKKMDIVTFPGTFDRPGH